MEIFGFKSFPEKTTIDFSSGVSAIVGPNGSGKSNIVDALRWVLGEQGDKALRSERREDVVFSGTSKRKPLSVAEVALTIQNNRNILPTEYSEVQIARRFFRSGETEYYLNGTKVRLKDIKNLFVDTGIGSDAYSVIELKMIETILSHVKNERRKMFEEAAGIISYKQNRDLTFKKLESVKETLTRVNDIIREKQRNVNALERQAKKNEEAKIVFNDLRMLEIVFYSYEYDKLIDEIKSIKEHEHENISLKQTLETEISEGNEKYDLMQEEIKVFEDISQTYTYEFEDVRETINSLEKDNLVKVEKSGSYKRNIERLTEENDGLEESISKNASKIEELSQKVNVINRTLEMSEISLTEKKANVDKTINLINEKKTEISELGIKLKASTKQLAEKRSEYDISKITLEKNLERMKRISESSEEGLKEISQLENDKYEYELLADKLNDELKKAESRFKELSDTKTELENNISDLAKSITENTILSQNKKSKISYLRNLIDSFEDYAEGIKYLKKEKKLDYVNTVIDSVDVEDKFKIAVETAFGEVSNYLILDDARYLDKLIADLNSSEKGKVTFILNDKLYSDTSLPVFFDFDFYNPGFLKTKGVYGFADRIVKCKNKNYELLIRYLLDEYIIVEDADTAFKLSRDNYYKFITLDGDIITQSVVRAGGKTKEENLKIGRENQITKLESEDAELENILSGQNSKLQEIENELKNLELDAVKDELDRIAKDSGENNNKIALVEFKLKDLNNRVSENDELYNKIKSDNVSLNTLINELIEQLNRLENEQSNFEKELGFLSEEFTEIDIKHTENQTDYNTFLIEYNRLKNELKNEENNLSRVRNNKEYQENQLTKNRRTIEDETLKVTEFEDVITSNNKSTEELKIKRGLIKKKLDENDSKLNEKKSEKEVIELDQRNKRREFDRVSKLLIDSQIKIKEYEIKSEQYTELLLKKYEIKVHEIPDDIKEELNKVRRDYTGDDGTFDEYTSRKDIDNLSEKLKKLGGGYQQIIWDDYQTEKDELERMSTQRDDLLESERDIKKTIERINNEAKERFLQTFEEIRQNFIRIFKELFQEGDECNLKLIHDEDEDGKLNDDPLEAKIEITAKPRGKRPTSIELLSGGEKTLTAIALLFAIYLVKPSPFCVLDEVDAPLDVANLARFNRMIRKFSEKTQFILITHNERTMETVDTLYGVTMQEPGVTTIVETRFKESQT
ncbi:MAG: chromosome segregation protein SMC [Ignavibacteria bacterium]|nr:chromosome segregation protein SMC [Ignavibacteria bacterium]